MNHCHCGGAVGGDVLRTALLYLVFRVTLYKKKKLSKGVGSSQHEACNSK